MLLGWAEAKAREHNCTLLSLAVLNGNPARWLYQRVGFKVVETDVVDWLCVACCTVCLVGRPYGVCDAHCGAIDMTKRLE